MLSSSLDFFKVFDYRKEQSEAQNACSNKYDRNHVIELFVDITSQSHSQLQETIETPLITIR